jgi:hypothetical protein
VAPEAKSLMELLTNELGIMQHIAENGGEITPELDAMLVEVELDVATKVDNYALVLERFKFEQDHWKAKSDFYRKLAKAAERVQDRLTDAIKQVALARGTDEVKGVDYRFKLVRQKDAVDVNEDVLPRDYKKAVTEWVPEKERILQDLDLGLEIPGAVRREVFGLRTYPNHPDKPAKKPKKEQ